MIQGLWGRLGKKPPEAPPTTPDFLTRSVSPLEPDDFPSARVINDDEDSNWDDEEAPEMDATSGVSTPSESAPASPTPSEDLSEDWDDALPAPSVKSETTAVSRVQPQPKPKTEDWWESIPTAANPVPGSPPPVTTPPVTPPNQVERAIGLWADLLARLRQILPAPLQNISDAILTAIVVVLVTLGIWTVDGLLTPAPSPQVVTTQPVISPPTDIAQLPPASNPPPITPEQTFISSIQAQIAEITGKYPDDIIQTLQVDLPSNRVIIRLNNVWYLISDSKQNEVTDRMWQETLANHFTKLELQDPHGELIARSPVVGKHMIVLKRRATL
jgi:hypothetical protein